MLTFLKFLNQKINHNYIYIQMTFIIIFTSCMTRLFIQIYNYLFKNNDSLSSVQNILSMIISFFLLFLILLFIISKKFKRIRKKYIKAMEDEKNILSISVSVITTFLLVIQPIINIIYSTNLANKLNLETGILVIVYTSFVTLRINYLKRKQKQFVVKKYRLKKQNH